MSAGALEYFVTCALLFPGLVTSADADGIYAREEAACLAPAPHQSCPEAFRLPESQPDVFSGRSLLQHSVVTDDWIEIAGTKWPVHAYQNSSQLARRDVKNADRQWDVGHMHISERDRSVADVYETDSEDWVHAYIMLGALFLTCALSSLTFWCCTLVQMSRESEPALDADGPGASGPSERKSADQAFHRGSERMRYAQPLMNDYVLGTAVGHGCYGTVYSCARKGQTDFCLAVKMIDKVEMNMEAIRLEAENMLSVEHPNIVRCYDICFEKFFVCLVMDRLRGGDLTAAMQAYWKSTSHAIPVVQLTHIFKQALLAVQYLHANQIVHRDVKGDNFFLDLKDFTSPDVRLVLGDLGDARKLGEKERLHQRIGSQLYWSPEMLRGDYGFKVDVWGLGITCFIALEAHYPFQRRREIENSPPVFTQKLSEVTKRFVLRMLEKAEADRPTAVECLEDPFIVSGPPQEANVGGGGAIDASDVVSESQPDAGVTERRKELVERLAPPSGRIEVDQKRFWQQSFTVRGKDDKSLSFAWWSRDRANRTLIAPRRGGGKMDVTLSNRPDAVSLEVLKNRLEEHGIDVSRWDDGSAMSLESFADEVTDGKAKLMLDASEHKKLIRVVDLVVLQIIYEVEPGTTVYLVEMPSQSKKPRLVGGKKEPYESTSRCVARYLKKLFGDYATDVSVDLDNLISWEERQESPSYPGVTTVYYKELVECRLSTSDVKLFQRFPASSTVQTPSFGMLNFAEQMFGGQQTLQPEPEGHSNKKQNMWITEDAWRGAHLEMFGSRHGKLDVSSVVKAPIGLKRQDLEDLLQSNGIDTALYGKHGAVSLADFASELIRGEASVITDTNENVVRLVDMVALDISRPDNDQVLMEESEARFPCACRRPDEHPFAAAQRYLTLIGMSLNHVHFQEDNVTTVTEEQASLKYPGVRTVHRKHLLVATLQH